MKGLRGKGQNYRFYHDLYINHIILFTIMGCIYSTPASESMARFHCEGWRDDNATYTLTNQNINEDEIDISHFSRRPTRILGIGGFGLVRAMQKTTGNDRGKVYALKSMSKYAILKRASGPCSVLTELKALVLLSQCRFVSKIQYAFQDERHLYMVLNLAELGDLRRVLRAARASRLSEDLARYLICQVLAALGYCHQASVLHRGETKRKSFGYSI